MYKMYLNKYLNKAQLLAYIIKEVDWNLKRQRNLGSLCEMLRLKAVVNRVL